MAKKHLENAADRADATRRNACRVAVEAEETAQAIANAERAKTEANLTLDALH